jgi:hypothetical protein
MNVYKLRLSFWVKTGTACILPAVASATGLGPDAEPWYKIASGIIGIPASLIALMIAYRLFRKTNLESRKLELEISEKQRQLQNIPEVIGSEAIKSLATLALGQRLSIVILRFVILELTLRIWDFVPTIVNYIALAAASAAALLLVDSDSHIAPFGLLAVAPIAIRLPFDVVYWFIVFGFGWPILRDACSILGIRITRLFDLPSLGRQKSPRR